MTAAMLSRTGSLSPRFEIHASPTRSPICGSALSLGLQSRSTTLSIDMRQRKEFLSSMRNANPLRRVRSDSDLISYNKQSSSDGRMIPTVRLSEVEEEDELAVPWSGAAASLVVAEDFEEVGISGGGKGNGKKSTGGTGGGSDQRNGDRRMGTYYEEMLRADPCNPLLLRNYAKFLHEVEGNLKKAEEFYERAILESPGDGDLLSLYGRLLWEFQRDGKRAEAYFERAVEASPDDCYVLGSYAHFLWDAEEEEDKKDKEGVLASPQPLVNAF
ncbi:hypothetical protein HPP92_014224 [Vanilla planifolia]|uniref:Uncharacterized protein n=1 Tax=Vanilla planifolia TaxID=51239 RepID=A0A835QMX7_VANPL|nr:hypothetical protein HPP92_014224 [Vanilla planifolia]